MMDALSHSTLSAIRDHFTQLHTSTTSTPEPPQPLLHLSVAMEAHSSLAIQLHQVPKKATQVPTESMLKEITRHMTLLTIYISGLNCHALFQTSKEVGGASKQILSSVDIVGDINIPVVQTSICCLVPKLHGEQTPLNLSSEQSQLSFELTQARDLTLCTLLEAGLKDVGVRLVAKLLQTEVHEETVMDWNHIHQYSGMGTGVLDHALETRNNQFVINVSIPLLWSQVASTHTGIAGPLTGGLDLLVLYEALEAWHEPVEGVASLIGKLVKDKTSRDRRVLLTIVANAARNSILFQKSFNPVHSDVTLALRHSVGYSCLQQLWQTLPAYSESDVPNEDSELFASQLVATTLAMCTRLYSQHEEAENKSHDPPTQDVFSETGSVGYVSISPSPSELAIPNAVLAEFLDLRDIDYDPVLSRMTLPMLLALREALLPIFNQTDVKVSPQLRPVCHNKALYSGGVGVAVREVSVFVMPPSHSHTRHKDTPVFHVEHMDVRSSLKYTMESTPPHPQITLLPSNMKPSDTHTSKVNVFSSCIVSLEGISLTLTTPLLKLGRHMMETARHRSHLTRLDKVVNEDNLVTPRPDISEPTVATPTEHRHMPPSEILTFTQSLVVLVRKYGGMGEATPMVSSPGSPIDSPQTVKHISPQDEGEKKLLSQLSMSSMSSGDVAIAMEDPRSPEVQSDTVGYDTPDSLHITSDNSLKLLSPKSYTSVPSKLTLKDHTSLVIRSLALTPTQLLFSVFGLLKIKRIEAGVQIETTRASLLFEEVSAVVDARKATEELRELLPTYLSAAATLKRNSLVLSDRGLPEAEVFSFKAQPVYVSAGLCGGVEPPTYRCLVKVCGVELSFPQSPAIIHRRYQTLMPEFKAVYQEVFASAGSQPTTPTAPVVNMSDVKLPPKLPQGVVHFILEEAAVVISPLPSLTVIYTVGHVIVM